MREIKFRGWHVSMKKMFSAETMEKDQMTILTTGNFINVSGRDTRESVIYHRYKFIPLQYTGLKDKNGKEIYEGDVLLFEDMKWEIEWDDQYCRYALITLIRAHVVTDAFFASNKSNSCEIIGNIYENPELLNG